MSRVALGIAGYVGVVSGTAVFAWLASRSLFVVVVAGLTASALVLATDLVRIGAPIPLPHVRRPGYDEVTLLAIAVASSLGLALLVVFFL